MEQKLGIKETKEAIVGLLELATCLAEKFNDGVQVKDFSELWAKLQIDEGFKKKLSDAYEGANGIPAELKDLDLYEGVEMSSVVLAYLPKIVDALKKK